MSADLIAKINAILNAFLGFFMFYEAAHFLKSKKRYTRIQSIIYTAIGLYWGIFYVLVAMESISPLGPILVGRVLVRPVLTILFTTIIIHMMWNRKSDGGE